jgi:hypothetical protein
MQRSQTSRIWQQTFPKILATQSSPSITTVLLPQIGLYSVDLTGKEKDI